MKEIKKYPLSERTTLALPVGSRVRHVAPMRGHLTAWIEQPIGAEIVERTFVLAPAAAILEDDLRFIAASPTATGDAFFLYEKIA